MDSERWNQLIDDAQAKVGALPAASPLRRAATAAWFADLRTELPAGNDAPPLLLLLNRSDMEQLHLFDEDVELVRAALPTDGSRNEFLSFGRHASAEHARQWSAGILEMAVQVRLLRELGIDQVELSPILPGGRKPDASVVMGERRIWIEISALSDGNDVIQEFDTSLPVQLVAGDPYLDARRVYRKVFDKAAGARPRSPEPTPSR